MLALQAADEDDEVESESPTAPPEEFNFFAMIPYELKPIMTELVSDTKFKVLAAPTMRTHPIAKTELLPHIDFPIGDWDDKSFLTLAVDTCAGLNMGRLQYHKTIYHDRPDLIHSFEEFDKTHFTSFGVGGVSQDGQGVIVEAVITYKLPYQVMGSRALLAIGLSSSLAATTIVGYPFIKKAKFTIVLHKMYAHSEVFGDSYKIQDKSPCQNEHPPHQDPEMGATLIATPKAPGKS